MDETLRTTELWLVCVHPKEEVRGRCYGDKKEVKVNGWHSKKTQVKHTKLVSFHHDQFLHHWPHSGFGQVVIFNRNVSPNSGFSDQTLSARCRWGLRMRKHSSVKGEYEWRVPSFHLEGPRLENTTASRGNLAALSENKSKTGSHQRE